MANHPAFDLATALAAGGSITLPDPPGGSVAVGYGSAPKNILSGPERDSDNFVTNQLINVLQTGGPPALPYLGVAPSEVLYLVRVQVLVRSQLDDFAGGEALARGAFAKLHLVELAGYIDVRAQESAPTYLGADERRLHRWSMNFAMRFKQ